MAVLADRPGRAVSPAKAVWGVAEARQEVPLPLQHPCDFRCAPVVGHRRTPKSIFVQNSTFPWVLALIKLGSRRSSSSCAFSYIFFHQTPTGTWSSENLWVWKCTVETLYLFKKNRQKYELGVSGPADHESDVRKSKKKSFQFPLF